ncbi:MAG TPA: hypothetical protein VHZ03_56305 [Trebonia sp.]|jgi:hypothetical protein|nr:hypothetical protein [Trebonia sp.]
MSQPLGGCPECGGDRPFEQIHAVAGECPDVPGGDCPEWACQACGAAVIMGTLPLASAALANPAPANRLLTSPAQARQSVHAA